MRELVSLQVGSCGNAVGLQFWETISNEHNINYCGHFYGNNIIPYQRLNVYYEKGPRDVYVPRTVLCDLEPASLDVIKCSPYGKVFNPDYFVAGQSGAGNNWARGHYTEGAELSDCVLDITRRQAEGCDCLQGFQMTHSLGGGSGSGMGSLLLKHLKDEYPDRVIQTYSIIPSAKVSDVVVEPYNAVLTLNEMINCTDETICFDNEALFDITQNTLKLCHPNLMDLNHLIAQTMAGVTASFRFPGQLNTDLRKIMTNMVPYPHLHFFIPGYAPLSTQSSEAYRQICISDLVAQMFDSRNQMAAFNSCDGRYLTCAAIFRGLISTKEVEQQLSCYQEKNSDLFVNWVPNNLKSAICDIPPCGKSLTATFLSNTTAIQVVFNRLLCQHRAMLEKRAYIHWYCGEGMEEEEFSLAAEGLQSLIDEYNESNQHDSITDDSDCDSPLSNDDESSTKCDTECS